MFRLGQRRKHRRAIGGAEALTGEHQTSYDRDDGGVQCGLLRQGKQGVARRNQERGRGRES